MKNNETLHFDNYEYEEFNVIASKIKEHLQNCKCSKIISIIERTLKAQLFPMQK